MEMVQTLGFVVGALINEEIVMYYNFKTKKLTKEFDVLNLFPDHSGAEEALGKMPSAIKDCGLEFKPLCVQVITFE